MNLFIGRHIPWICFGSSYFYKELLPTYRPMASRPSGKPRCPCERHFRSQLSPHMLEVWASSEGQNGIGFLKCKHLLFFARNVIRDMLGLRTSVARARTADPSLLLRGLDCRRSHAAAPLRPRPCMHFSRRVCLWYRFYQTFQQT